VQQQRGAGRWRLLGAVLDDERRVPERRRRGSNPRSRRFRGAGARGEGDDRGHGSLRHGARHLPDGGRRSRVRHPQRTRREGRPRRSASFRALALPAAFAGIAKAITAAYLSSEGNAFSTRTASQIIQENFNPREFSQPSGPLFGLQFSQLPCSDIPARTGTVGPKASPIGIAADAGGLPLYRNGSLIGAVGVMSDSLYNLDLDITDLEEDQDEVIAVAAAGPLMAPLDRRADRITADGRSFRFTDSEALKSNPANAPALRDIPGQVIPVGAFFDGTIRRGTAFNTPESGFRADPANADFGGHIVVDAAEPEPLPRARGHGWAPHRGRGDGSMLKHSLARSRTARARRCVVLSGLQAHATAVVVDTNGVVLGLAADRGRSGRRDRRHHPEGAHFGAFFSRPRCRGAARRACRAAQYAATGAFSSAGRLRGSRARAFLADPRCLRRTVIAWSTRVPSATSTDPNFPRRHRGHAPAGPLSKPIGDLEPVQCQGLQLDLVNNAVLGRRAGCGLRVPAADPRTASTIFRGRLSDLPRHAAGGRRWARRATASTRTT
jgi:hypothetical protein